MPTHAEVAADLLRAAATFFRNIADTNQELKEQMETNAETYDVIAGLVASDPQGGQYRFQPGLLRLMEHSCL